MDDNQPEFQCRLIQVHPDGSLIAIDMDYEVWVGKKENMTIYWALADNVITDKI